MSQNIETNQLHYERKRKGNLHTSQDNSHNYYKTQSQAWI